MAYLCDFLERMKSGLVWLCVCSAVKETAHWFAAGAVRVCVYKYGTTGDLFLCAEPAKLSDLSNYFSHCCPRLSELKIFGTKTLLFTILIEGTWNKKCSYKRESSRLAFIILSVKCHLPVREMLPMCWDAARIICLGHSEFWEGLHNLTRTVTS